MEKKRIQVKTEDFPEELRDLFEKSKVYDSSSNPTARVLYSDMGCYIKIAERGTLQRESTLAGIFERKGIGAHVVTYISDDKDYLVTEGVRGEDATHYLEDPERLCGVFAEAMKYLHSIPVMDIPVSPCMEQYALLKEGKKLEKDTLIHGDFCFPNIMMDQWKFSKFIDVGLAGAGDRHIDIYWLLWSLQYNLKTDQYADYFLDLYGREDVDEEILQIVTEVEKEAM